ncbi:MAG: hypothetical protein FWE24_04320 [Defluviitaleaceae bacterium]|nr:hypothetical protein [Defluviitaleaceae bacterium]
MNRVGVGSASIVLIFVILGLTIFTVTSFVYALTGQSLIDDEVYMIKAFYTADTLAEQILAEILLADTMPQNIMGVEIMSFSNLDLSVERVAFAIPIFDTIDLYVAVEIIGDSYEIISWRMYLTNDWDVDDILNVWQGFSDFISNW